MNMKKRSLILAVLAAMVFPSLFWPGTSIRVAPAKAASAPAIVASIPYWDQDRAAVSFRSHIDSIDYLSLFWYTVDRNGAIARYRDAHIDQEVIDFAHEHGVKVFLLIANLPDERSTTWDWQRIDPILRDQKKRQRFIAQALQLLAARNADGVTLDFESLRERQRAPFSRFVAEFAKTLHDHEKLLRVSVERRSTNAYTNGKDWRTIAAVADQLAIMSYDEHAEDTQPGPVASLPWLERTLIFAKSLGVPASKISLGVSLEGYDWSQQSGAPYRSAEGLQYLDVRDRQRRYRAESFFDGVSLSPFLRYSKNGRSHVVWYENQSSFRPKLQLAARYNAGSIFLWRLGGEDRRIWPMIAASR